MQLLARLLRAVAATVAATAIPAALPLPAFERDLPSLEPELRALDVDLLEGAAAVGRSVTPAAAAGKRGHESMDVAEAGQSKVGLAKGAKGVGLTTGGQFLTKGSLRRPDVA